MVLDSLLIISIILSLLAGVEFLLRPHQKQQIQDFFENLTLQVDEIKVPDFALNIHISSIQALFVMLTYFELVILTTLILIFQAPAWRAGGWLDEAFGQQGKTVQFVAIGLSAITLLFAWRWPLPNITRWLISDGTRKGIRIRSLGFKVLGYLFLGFYLLALIWAIGRLDSSIFQQGSSQQVAYMWVLLPIWPIFTIFCVVYQSFELIQRPKSSKVRLFLFSFKATLWRLLKYSKGAAGVIAFILTFILAVVKLVVG
ncbi:MAG: hypothetical protein AAGB19_21640 [Cyanobacteria bacterium P01_F01_bin.3]